MKPSNFENIIAFHEKFGILRPIGAILLDPITAEFRYKFLIEELMELRKATEDNSVEDFIDALIDLAYVAMGTAYMHGDNWDISSCLIHRLNVVGREFQQLPTNPIAIPPEEEVQKVYNHIMDQCGNYARYNHEGNMLLAIVMLHSIYDCARAAAIFAGFNWDLHWEEVHSKNMAKERASQDDPRSKRKNSLDIVKPEGWTGPDHTTIIELTRKASHELNN
jgi:predicted HAD superfamily Cof-like phosphohydrolase